MPGWRNPACRQAGADQKNLKLMYYVYILRSLKTGNFYKGLTNNVNRRIAEHLNGSIQTTKNSGPWKLVHVEICNSRIEARKLEKYFKSGFGREIIQEISRGGGMADAHDSKSCEGNTS